MYRPLLLATFAALAPCGCATLPALLRPAPAMPLYRDEGEMRAEVLRHVWVGMLVGEAKRVMESNGFRCAFEDDWAAILHPDSESPVARYLECTRGWPGGGWLGDWMKSEETRVLFSFESGKVTGLHVSHVQTCA